MELVSRVHARRLVEWASDKPQVVVLSADLTGSTEIDAFRDAYPDRFFPLGMAEQNMIGVAGGLAREGLIPLVHTFAVFLYRRAYDQIADSIAYPNLAVRLFGFLPGVTTPGGATHQAIEDIAVLRALPNMTILECGDATEVESVLDVAHAVDGPVYVRMLRGEIPRLFDPQEPMRLGQARTLRSGGDLTLFSSGICTEEAMRTTTALAEQGVQIEHLHISTLKPFDDPAVVRAAAKARAGVITMENHTILGGLGTAVAERMAEAGLGQRLMCVGIRDRFLHGASRPYLMREYGLDAMALIGAVEQMLGQRFGIDESALAAVRLDAVHSDAKAEAL